MLRRLVGKTKMSKRDFSVLSSDNVHTLKGVIYFPPAKPLGLIHIVHGMTEHIGRYEKIMTDFANHGYICFGYDNLGHGKTATDDNELGFIAKKKGYDLLAKDVKIYSDAVLKEYATGEQRLPYYLLGHSMGSFITRLAVTKYLSPDKFIIMGTGGKNFFAGIGLAVIKIIKLFRGEKHVSPLVDKLAFGSYNKRFGGGTKDDPSPWLTRDIEVRKKYYADRFCTFKFTVSAMGDLIRLNAMTNSNKWYKSLPKDMPILLVSGENDPVGNYGKGITQVFDKLNKYGVKAERILYSDARHEILNDTTYPQVLADLLEFIKN